MGVTSEIRVRTNHDSDRLWCFRGPHWPGACGIVVEGKGEASREYMVQGGYLVIKVPAL